MQAMYVHFQINVKPLLAKIGKIAQEPWVKVIWMEHFKEMFKEYYKY